MAVLWATAYAAAPKHELVGANRQQVISRYGEPRSQVLLGNREILFFSRERVELRDGVVTEVEMLAVETAPRTAAPGAEPSAASATTAERPSPSAPTTTTPGAASSKSGAAPAAKSGSEPEPKAAAAPPEPSFEIKSVRPSGAPPVATVPKQKASASPSPGAAVPAPPAPAADPARPSTAPAAAIGAGTTSAGSPSSPAVSGAAATPTATPPATSRTTRTRVASAAPATTPAPDATKTDEATVEPPAEPAAQKKTATKAARRDRPEPVLPDASDAILTPRTYVITFIILAGGIGYLVWRHRQRQLELAATTVTQTPFAAPQTPQSGAVFTADLLSKLEWKRFEELVAAYYSKTGVVATRTKAGPQNPVNIKISWKGEAQPFACVKCIAHPPGLVDVKPLQDLVAVLNAEDIRRGYVVSTGKFSVPARDFAEEKLLTLLPGDLFLEKLNALPDAARSELMQQVATGDYSTPSCPKCDAKMVRSTEDPHVWKCTAHPDQQIVMRK